MLTRQEGMTEATAIRAVSIVLKEKFAVITSMRPPRTMTATAMKTSTGRRKPAPGTAPRWVMLNPSRASTTSSGADHFRTSKKSRR